ncbi:unnamed protein product, partial [Closterium sp. NIES-54]
VIALMRDINKAVGLDLYLFPYGVLPTGYERGIIQVIALLRDINKAVGLDLYLFPYGVLPTGYERGIIQVVPNTRSRNQMGDVTDGGLFDIFQNEFGAIGSAGFERARHNFIVSSAAYAVASLLLQPKDRHNGNLLVDK